MNKFYTIWLYSINDGAVSVETSVEVSEDNLLEKVEEFESDGYAVGDIMVDFDEPTANPNGKFVVSGEYMVGEFYVNHVNKFNTKKEAEAYRVKLDNMRFVELDLYESMS